MQVAKDDYSQGGGSCFGFCINAGNGTAWTVPLCLFDVRSGGIVQCKAECLATCNHAEILIYANDIISMKT